MYYPFDEQGDSADFLSTLSEKAQEIVRVAYDCGIGEAVWRIYCVAKQHNLALTFYDDTDDHEPTVSIVPPRNRSHHLFRVRMQPIAGRVSIYLHAEDFQPYYRATPAEVMQAFGGSGWLSYAPDSIDDFVRAFDELFERIEERQGKQLRLFDGLPDDDAGDDVQAPALQGETSEEVAPYMEGAQYDVILTRHERNLAARADCLAHHGSACSVCGIDFEQVYGDVGAGYIHVHHLTPLAHGDGQRLVDPIHDLRPVCPNCHAMLHRSDPPLTIAELREIIRHQRAAQQS